MRQPREGDRAPLRELATPLDVPVGKDRERSRQQAHGLAVGTVVERPGGGTLGELDRVIDPVASGCSLATVERDLGELRAGLEALAGRKRLCGRVMEPRAATGAEARVHRVAREGVREPIAARADLVDEPGRRCFLEEGKQCVIGATRHRRQRRDVERFAEHGGGGKRLRARRREALDARANEVADPFRHVAE